VAIAGSPIARTWVSSRSRNDGGYTPACSSEGAAAASRNGFVRVPKRVRRPSAASTHHKRARTAPPCRGWTTDRSPGRPPVWWLANQSLRSTTPSYSSDSSAAVLRRCQIGSRSFPRFVPDRAGAAHAPTCDRDH
jgi:hypothetical protein